MRSVLAMLPLIPQLVVLSHASTDGPWLVAVQPGTLVSIADFDMSATSANGVDVVGEDDGRRFFSACACQSGTVDEAATITTKYPGSQLDPKARVPRAEM